MLVKMIVRSKKETQFWIHAFHLEKDIEEVTTILNQKKERMSAFCPIIQEYEAGEMYFHILLGTTVDALGLANGMGKIWLSTNKEHKEEAEKEWRKFGDDLLSDLQKSGKWDETLEIEIGREV